eukprot:gb/GEZN01006275.1/.p1 GENE.gb/GEZN01006275.1/~~gb/GEZN01006275.1/.p1  ORF type:complete len:508 (+),score=41.51 gb/GEZN01006275.1/:31-1554(+)
MSHFDYVSLDTGRVANHPFSPLKTAAGLLGLALASAACWTTQVTNFGLVWPSGVSSPPTGDSMFPNGWRAFVGRSYHAAEMAFRNSTSVGAALGKAPVSTVAKLASLDKKRMHVGVLGGGIGGCSAAATLARGGLQVGLHEMGRGLGGRTATRRTREDQRIFVNHGAPQFDVQTAEGLRIIKDLLGRGFVRACREGVKVWNAPAGSLFSSPTRGAPVFEGHPNMDRVCEGLVDGCPEGTLKLHFGKMVRALEPPSGLKGWRLRDQDGELLGEYDWLVVAGSGPAHSRWRAVFGGEPPLVKAASVLSIDTGKEYLSRAIEVIEAMGSLPVQALLMAFEGDSARAWNALPFSLLEVKGHDVLAKVSIQRLSEELVAVVAHSTHAFAESARDTHGSSSTAARVGGAVNKQDREKEVVTQLREALEEAIARPGGLIAPENVRHPTWGPMLHRWGNAFPQGTPLSYGEAVIPQARVAFCGDYVGERAGSVEGAILSGHYIAAEVLEYANKRD